MSDVWSARAQAFRDSPTHREGPDLDVLVEMCEPGEGVKVLDVATAAVTSRGGCVRKGAPSSRSIPLRGCNPT